MTLRDRLPLVSRLPRRAPRAHPWRRRLVLAFGSVAGASLASVFGGFGLVAVAAGAISGLGVTASVLLYRRNSSRLGKVTSVLAVAIVWAVASLLIAVASSHCPGTTGARCDAQQSGEWMVSGFIIPLLPALVVLPALWTARTLRLLWNVSRHRATLRPAPLTPSAAERPAHRAPTGRVTAKGTRPARSR